jgi:hypothetical protein
MTNTFISYEAINHKDGTHRVQRVTRVYGRDMFPATTREAIRDDLPNRQAAKHTAERLNGDKRRPFVCKWDKLSDRAYKSMQRALSLYADIPDRA